MSDHAAAHHDDHGHGHGEEHHSHIKTYLTVGGILTVLTIVELVILPDILGGSLPPAMINWTLVILSIVKLLFVIGVFMHLKDDRQIYSVLFVSPMIIAVIMIVVLMAMAIGHYDVYAKGYAPLLDGPGAIPAPVVWTEDEFKTNATEAAKGEFAAGKAIFATNCVGCHRVDGGGLVGPALTDDCYIHGGDYKNIENILINGSLAKGMPAWKNVISDEDIRNVTMYVRSLRGTEVPNPKACEGAKAAN